MVMKVINEYFNTVLIFKEHFYLETQASLVVPKDAKEIEMFVSTQNANKTQVSKTL